MHGASSFDLLLSMFFKNQFFCSVVVLHIMAPQDLIKSFSWLECVVHSLFKSSILAVLVLPQSVWLKRIVSVSLLVFPDSFRSIIFDALYATNSKEMEPTTTTSQVSNMVTSSQVSKHSSKSPLIQIGMNGQVINILKEIILQGREPINAWFTAQLGILDSVRVYFLYVSGKYKSFCMWFVKIMMFFHHSMEPQGLKNPRFECFCPC
ncbi:hypothetical protein P8452_46637 [Trifolium repens]|nr:hypothetical protein P8452_46637 [Trifolium repens]